MFKVGDKVKINYPGASLNNQIGVVDSKTYSQIALQEYYLVNIQDKYYAFLEYELCLVTPKKLKVI